MSMQPERSSDNAASEEDIRRLREELRPSLERAARGEGRRIDFDELKRQVRERLMQARVPE